MAWTKIKITIAASAIALLAAGTATVAIVNYSSDGTEAIAREILQKTEATYASFSSFQCTGKTVTVMEGTAGTGRDFPPEANAALTSMNRQTNEYRIKMARPNLYLIEWESKVHANHTNLGAVWSAGESDLAFMVGKTQKMNDRRSSLSRAAGVSSGATANMPSAFFESGTNNSIIKFADASDLKQENDEKIGGVDCYVLSRSKDLPTTEKSMEMSGAAHLTIWIAKRNGLIHQRQTITKDFKVTLPGGGGTLSAKRMILTESFENIVVNAPVAKEDFVYAVRK